MEHRHRLSEAMAMFVDVVAVLVFVVIGRSTHDHGERLSGVAATSWPFLVGLAVGWALLVWRGRRGTSVVDGVVVALSTVALGMALRVVAGQGTALAFVIVATGFLGACMVGWRLLLRRRRGSEPHH
jgi:hypothetical protein